MVNSAPVNTKSNKILNLQILSVKEKKMVSTFLLLLIKIC